LSAGFLIKVFFMYFLCEVLHLSAQSFLYFLCQLLSLSKQCFLRSLILITIIIIIIHTGYGCVVSLSAAVLILIYKW
jgi:hypothetical protein